MILRERIVALPENRELILSPTGLITRDTIAASRLQPALVGARIALRITDPGAALKVLAVLDGTAEHILLLSPAIETELAVRLAARCGCDGILCDQPTEFATLDGPGAFGELEALALAFAGRRTAPGETRWIMTTSGTTGEPKLVGHTLSSLSRSSRTDPGRGHDQRWGLLYDYTRFAGLQVFLQSVLSGALLIAPAYDAPLERKLEVFVEYGCTCLSGTPTLWRKIVMTPGHEKLALRQATLGGEIVDDRILATVGATYPKARVTHIFASTEAGVGFSVADGRAGFPESYLTDPPPGVEIRMRNGRLHVRNRQVNPAYLDSETTFANDDGWVNTGDVVERRDGRVYFLGRESGVINVGGDKVHPEEVERILLAHPEVAAARIYSKANPITGGLVAADIVPSDASQVDAKALRDSLRAHAAKHLERHKVPAIFKIVPSFEINTAGKLIRKKA